MDRILYITMAEINPASGVYKKIKGQQNAFANIGYECDILFVSKGPKLILDRVGKDLIIVNTEASEFVRYITSLLDSYQVTYFRFELLRHKYFRKIIRITRKKNITRVLEIPTYPPVKESLARTRAAFLSCNYLRGVKTLIGAAFVFLDTYVFMILVNYVIIIAAETTFPKINCIRIENGLDVSSIPPWVLKRQEKNYFTIIAVSNFSYWNGYDRLIWGLKNYVTKNNDLKIKIVFVGNIENAKDLVLLTNKLGVSSYISFVGEHSGNSLDNLFNESEIAMGALGNHRRGVFKNSSLKGKEYCVRGIPVVVSTAESMDEEILQNLFIVPSDETPIDFDSIIEWYFNIQNISFYSEKLRNLALSKFSWERQLAIVIDSINFSKKI